MGTSIAGYAPLVGKDVQVPACWATATVGQEALLRFYVLHVAVLPVGADGLVAIHFWRIRKDGGLARPEEDETGTTSPASVSGGPASPVAALMTMAVAAAAASGAGTAVCPSGASAFKGWCAGRL